MQGLKGSMATWSMGLGCQHKHLVFSLFTCIQCWFFYTYLGINLGINCMLAAKASGIPVLPRAWALWRYEDTEMFCNNPDSGSITRRDSSSQPRVQRLLSFANFTSYQLLILCGLSLMPFWVITSGSVIYLFICLFQDSGVAGEGEKDKV